MNRETLRVGIAQLTPVWLDKAGTLALILDTMKKAAKEGVELLVFGEAFWPGYPFWLGYLNGAAWELPENKALHAHYLQNAVVPEEGDLEPLVQMSLKLGMSVYLGMIERPKGRGGHSLYCALAYIDPKEGVRSIHRKLQPTYDERLTWAPGDGNGLQVHPLKSFSLGGLNCWENWMPLVRASLYGQGENVHVAVWPGSDFNTRDITRFIARESRSYVVSASSLMRRDAIPGQTPQLDHLLAKLPEKLANGGSCIAAPDGSWVMEPQADTEGIFVQELSLKNIYEARQNFDPSGHYSRPDVTRLTLNRNRQSVLDIEESDI
jgi:nitrilase